jgi:hypothetical protein
MITSDQSAPYIAAVAGDICPAGGASLSYCATV